MKIADIKNRLALIEGGGVDSDNNPVTGIDGVKRAYAQGPASLPESDMPVFVNFTGPTLEFTKIGWYFLREKRQFNCRLYVSPIQGGIDGEAERKVEPFIEAGMRQFLAHLSFGDGNPDDLIEEVFVFDYLGDSGVATFAYAGAQYLGVEFRVAVTAILEQEPAPFE